MSDIEYRITPCDSDQKGGFGLLQWVGQDGQSKTTPICTCDSLEAEMHHRALAIIESLEAAWPKD